MYCAKASFALGSLFDIRPKIEAEFLFWELNISPPHWPLQGHLGVPADIQWSLQKYDGSCQALNIGPQMCAIFRRAVNMAETQRLGRRGPSLVFNTQTGSRLKRTLRVPSAASALSAPITDIYVVKIKQGWCSFIRLLLCHFLLTKKEQRQVPHRLMNRPMSYYQPRAPDCAISTLQVLKSTVRIVLTLYTTSAKPLQNKSQHVSDLWFHLK